MSQATFRFHGEINDFLPHPYRQQLIRHTFDWRASIKDMVESLGVPHPEIELLVVNGQSVDFEYIVQPDVDVDVYARLHDAPPEHQVTQVRLRSDLVGRPRFVLDTHLGRLASYLRMMGFDTLYRNDYSDDELAVISNTQERVLLTRDIGLLKRSLVIHGRFMRNTDPKRQIVEIVQRHHLSQYFVPLQRCLKCNGILNHVEKADILHQLTTTTAETYDVFHQCQDCGQIYWKGSHYDSMREFMAQVIDKG